MLEEVLSGGTMNHVVRVGDDAGVRASAERLHVVAAWTDRHAATAGDPALAENGGMYRRRAAWLLRNVG